MFSTEKISVLFGNINQIYTDEVWVLARFSIFVSFREMFFILFCVLLFCFAYYALLQRTCCLFLWRCVCTHTCVGCMWVCILLTHQRTQVERDETKVSYTGLTLTSSWIRNHKRELDRKILEKPGLTI
jgi:hypothetical protein